MDRKWIAAAAIVASLCASPSHANDQDTESDVRCLLIGMNMVQGQNTVLQTAGMMSVMYWMGRLDGRTPDLDLENRLIADIKELKPDALQAEAKRCGAILQVSGKFMTEMGQDMQQKGHQMQQLENSR